MIRFVRDLAHGRLGAFCAFLVLAACAGAGGSSAGSSGASAGAPTSGGARETQAKPSGAAAPEKVAAAPPSGAQFTPNKPAAANYGPDKKYGCTRNEVFKYVMEDLTAAAKRAGRQPPVEDGRVCALADAFLAWEPQSQGIPRGAVLQFASHWVGLPAAIQPPNVATFDTQDARVIADRLVQALAGSVVNSVYPRLAVATKRFGRNSTKIAFVFLDAPIEVDPFPRRLELGQQATLTGRLVGGSKNPQVFVSDASGGLSTPQQPPGEAFKADVKCGNRPGKIIVEVRGEYEGNSGIAANFPIACGTELPQSVALASEPWPSDPAAAEKKILDQVNADRTAAGLKPVETDPAVAKVAHGISEDIASRGGVVTGDIGDRLRKEGIGTPLVLQSAVSDRTFERAQERLMSSPTNRANIMNPDVTHVGMGALSRMDAEGKSMAYVTEVFLKELPAADVSKVRQNIRDAVAQKRKDARTTAVASDPTLEKTAQKFAEALAEAGGTLPKERAGEITQPLNSGFKQVVMISGAKPEPLDFAEESQATAPGKSLGVGAALGRHPVLGRNAVYVVLMVGTPREGATKPAASKGKSTGAKTTKPAGAQ